MKHFKVFFVGLTPTNKDKSSNGHSFMVLFYLLPLLARSTPILTLSVHNFYFPFSFAIEQHMNTTSASTLVSNVVSFQ